MRLASWFPVYFTLTYKEIVFAAGSATFKAVFMYSSTQKICPVHTEPAVFIFRSRSYEVTIFATERNETKTKMEPDNILKHLVARKKKRNVKIFKNISMQREMFDSASVENFKTWAQQ